MDKLKEAQELERKASQLRMEAHAEAHQKKVAKEQKFREDNDLDVYTSDDYCGLSASKYSFYYGYEVTVCPKHGKNSDCEGEHDCEKNEWAFEATVNGKVVMTMPTSKLHPKEGEDPFWYLIAGIGHFIKDQQK